MKFTICRSTWLRGRPYESTLLNDAGEKCCLGFLALSIDETAQIRNQFTPYGLNTQMGKNIWPKGMVECDRHGASMGNSSTTRGIMACNDMDDTTDLEKEELLKGLFKSIDIEVEFID